MIKNIILDFGGVLLNISYEKTRDAFVNAGVIDFDHYYQQSYSNPLFADLEMGLISPEAFYEKLRSISGTSLSDQEIESCWNALLGDYRKSSLAYLSELKKVYKLFLFSNTNVIHYNAFMKTYQDSIGAGSFEDYFDRVYYSHTLHARKPDPKSYLLICKAENLPPAETLFVDDSLVNIEGARAAGLEAYWLENGAHIEEVLPGVLNKK